ncbi:MAG: Tex family protein [Burkholderiaceae bacterium]
MRQSIEQRLAEEMEVREPQVLATVALLDEGATVPFIARYRKEVTGGLDDTQLRMLAERLIYMRELDERCDAIKAAVAEQGKLTDALTASLEAAQTKQRLEDLYAPFKKKRRTKAQIAREAGLEPLAQLLLADPAKDPQVEAAAFLKPAFTTDAGDNPGVEDAVAALDGARQILMEQFAEDADLVGRIRNEFQTRGVVLSQVVKGKEEDGAKFADYFGSQEPLSKIPSHRAMALLRGRREQVLRVSLALDDEVQSEGEAATGSGSVWCESQIAANAGIRDLGRPADNWLIEAARWTWQVKLSSQISAELMTALRERAEADAIDVFGRNLKDLLLAAPAGRRPTMGLDPGLRTGVKVAIVDATGKLLAADTIYPHPPRKDTVGSIAKLAGLAKTHGVELVAVGNGTGSRETTKLVNKLAAKHPELKLTQVSVSEAGASVYSASALAAKEFPGLDVSLRGAVSIARRLQDPLAELVKIEPKAIGVGQYQHDVSETRLARALDAVVEDCVNGVGVDVNIASIQLLSRIAGLSAAQAENIVQYRDENGAFKNRQQLLSVNRLGERAYEQAAGFLRILDGDNPLDGSAVHPEAYPLVEKMLTDIGAGISEVIGKPQAVAKLTPDKYVNDHFGLPTIIDILKELEKPGRDPRPGFKTASFKDGIEKLADLKPDMVLEGVVTNVAAFGAFVDIGVHQDGLVHISALADKFVSDAHQVVKAGDVVKVKVLEVDAARKRIGLTMRLNDPQPDENNAPGSKPGSAARKTGRNGAGRRKSQAEREVTAENKSAKPDGRPNRGGKRPSDTAGKSDKSADRSDKSRRPNRGKPRDDSRGGRPREDKQPSAMALALAAAGANKLKASKP